MRKYKKAKTRVTGFIEKMEQKSFEITLLFKTDVGNYLLMKIRRKRGNNFKEIAQEMSKVIQQRQRVRFNGRSMISIPGRLLKRSVV